jgi:hypothetical protein
MTASTPNANPEPPATDPEAGSPRQLLDLVRIGVVVGACLALVLSAVVVLGASPAPGATGADPKSSGDPGGSSHRSGLPGGLFGLRGLFGGGRGSVIDGLRGFGGAVGSRSITITSIDGSSVTLKTDDGWTRTITIAPDTKIDRDGQTASAGVLKVGDQVVLRQKKNDDGTYSIVALSVRLPVVAGTVTAIDGNSVTIKSRDGSSRTVTLDGSTSYKLGPTDGKKADLKVGSLVAVTGTEGPSDAFSASTVRIQVRLDRVGGEVTAKTKDSITVKQRDGTSATIQIGADTKFFVRGATTPGLTDVVVGMSVTAIGTKNADGSLDASWVAAGKAHTDAKPKPAASPTGTGTSG